jgi:hypothetical protein
VRARIEAALAQHDGQTVALGPLSEAAACAMAARLVRSSATAGAIAREAAGHPGFIQRLAPIGAAAEDHRDRPDPNDALRLEDLFAMEAVRLSSPGRRALELVALAGTPVRAALLAHAVGGDDVVDELRGCRLLARLRGRGPDAFVDVAHPRVGAFLRTSLDVVSRQLAHAALAEALEHAGPDDAERIAVHWEAAGDATRAALSFELAADAALAAGMGPRAVELLGRSLATQDDPDAERRLRTKLGEALAAAGEPERAAEAFLDAAASAPLAEGIDLQRRAAMLLLLSGRFDEGAALARPLLQAIGVRWAQSAAGSLAVTAWERARLRSRGLSFVERTAAATPWSASAAPPVGAPDAGLACDVLWSLATSFSLTDLVRASALHTRGLRLALDLGEPRRLARALALEGMHGVDGDRHTMLRSRGVIARAESLALKVGDPYSIGYASLAASSLHTGLAEHADAERKANDAVSAFRNDRRRPWELGWAHALALTSRAALGRFSDVEVRYGVAEAEARASGHRCALVCVATTARLFVDVVADRPDEGQAVIERVMREWPGDANLPWIYATLALTALDLYRGGGPAWSRFEAAWPRLRTGTLLRGQRARIQVLSTRALAALAALEAGEATGQPTLVRVVRRCAAKLAGEGLADAVAMANLLQGQLASWQGEEARAAARYAAARDLYASLDLCGWRVAAQRLAELRGGDDGLRAMGENEAWARAEGLVAPDRFFAMLAPVRGPRRRATS